MTQGVLERKQLQRIGFELLQSKVNKGKIVQMTRVVDWRSAVFVQSLQNIEIGQRLMFVCEQESQKLLGTFTGGDGQFQSGYFVQKGFPGWGVVYVGAQLEQKLGVGRFAQELFEQANGKVELERHDGGMDGVKLVQAVFVQLAKD